MVTDHPELESDIVFRSQLGIKFNSDNQFGESVEIEHMLKKIDFISGLADIKEKNGEEEEEYFNRDFLIEKFLGLSIQDRNMNKIYQEREKNEGITPETTADAATPSDTAESSTPPTGETQTEEPSGETPAPEGETSSTE